MDTLSLRVSSIKTTENLKKNSEVKIGIVKLSPYMQYSSKFSKIIDKFEESKSCEQQVAAVKMFGTFFQDADRNEMNDICTILSEICFVTPPKHPILSTVVRMLRKHDSFDFIKMCIKQKMDSFLEFFNYDQKKSNHNSNIHTFNNVVIKLNVCFDTFQLSKRYEFVFDNVYKFVDSGLKFYMKELIQPHSPAEKCEIFLFIHNIIRLCISTIYHNQDIVSEVTNSPSESILNVQDECRKLITINDVPMDTKVICGIFLVKSINNCNLLKELEKKNENQLIYNICICIGIISGIGTMHIYPPFIEKNSVMDIIGENLVTLPIKENLFENDQSLLLAVCRGLNQSIQKIKSSYELFDDINVNILADSYCIQIYKEFIERFHNHHLDSVRHLCKDLLKNIYNSIYSLRMNFLSNINHDLSLPDTLQRLYFECECQTKGTNHLIEKFPTLNLYLFEKLLTDSEWLSTYEIAMINDRSNATLLYERWIRPIIYHSKIAHDFIQVNEYLINKAIIHKRDIAFEIIYKSNDLPLETYLYTQWTMRKIGFDEGSSFSIWQPAEDKLIRLAKFHPNDDTRIMPLKIIVDVHKKTQFFTENDLNEILSFFKYNCNCQSPAMRGQIFSYIRKAFQRFAASLAVANRTKQNKIQQFYKRFYFDFIDLCTANVCTGANFSRRSLSLKSLLTLITTMKDVKNFPIDDIWTTKLLTTLIDNLLDDTYETNKSLINEILWNCPQNILNANYKPHLSTDDIARLATSIKPGDSITAAYYLELCCLKQWNNFNDYYTAITWCTNLCISGLNVAEKSLMLAARQNPMYGLVFCIRHLLSKCKLTNDLPEKEMWKWRIFFESFIRTCKRLTDVVSPIVNSSSPEGHLPNDFSDLSTYLPNDIDLLSEPALTSSSSSTFPDDRQSTTPQMVLLCAWRTTRDVSLLLGELTLHLPIRKNASDKNGLITIDEILDIGEHFQKLLSETKHRGGFEQAYVGFSKLCVRLWRSSEKRLHQCPMQWLHELIELISSTADDAIIKREKICATRRSAGIPFIIQALITSELQVCSTSGLQFCMKKLLQLCQSSDVTGELRTHGLNILRALFRCSDLGDAVTEYVAEAIECAILGYNAITWPERNSATLLFSALMIRIFGVQRTRNTEPLGIRNKMTGRIFFLKYPRLYDFINMQLIASSELIKNNERPTTLHPLLILLSRLYPSALEGSESNLQLSAFLPTLGECIKSPELETRRLAVKSIVALIQPNQVVLYSLEIVQLLTDHLNQPIKNSNTTHGYLLQLHALIESMPRQKSEILKFNEFKNLFEKLINLNIFKCENFVLIKTYADTLNQIIIRLPRDELMAIESININESLISIFRKTDNVHIIGLPESMKSCIILHLFVTLSKINETREYLLYQSINDKSFEYIKTILCLNETILSKSNNNTDEIDVNNFVNYLTETEISIIKENLQKCENLINELYDLIDKPIFYPYCTIMCYSILCEMKIDNFQSMENQFSIENHWKLLKNSVNEPDVVKEMILKYILTYFNHNQLKINDKTEEPCLLDFLKILKKFAHPNCSDDLRLIVANFVAHIIANYWNECVCDKETIFLLFDLLLILARDDESDIREIIGKIIIKNVSFNFISSDEIGSIFQCANSTVIEELICHFMCETFEKLSTSRMWQLLVEFLQQQLNDIHDNDDCDNSFDSDTEIFDKNELNTFGEPLLICKMIYKHLHNYIKINDSLSNDDKEKIYTEIDLKCFKNLKFC